MRARITLGQKLTTTFCLLVVQHCAFAQTSANQPDTLGSFLSAFRGKPVATVPDVSYSAVPAAPASPQYAATNQTFGNRNPAETGQPSSCPPGVDRMGCPSTYPSATGPRATVQACPPGYQRDPTGCVMPAMPLNAHRVGGYGGWACDIGYVRSGDACSPVVVPVNGHPADTPAGWACNYGYHLTVDRCAPVFVPANAHLATDGSRFECNYGYRDMGMSCGQ
jgi:hypothetical protein